MVDGGRLGERLADQGLVDVVAGERTLGSRPVFAVIAAAP